MVDFEAATKARLLACDDQPSSWVWVTRVGLPLEGCRLRGGRVLTQRATAVDDRHRFASCRGPMRYPGERRDRNFQCPKSPRESWRPPHTAFPLAGKRTGKPECRPSARRHARRRRARALHGAGHPLGEPALRCGKPGLGRAPDRVRGRLPRRRRGRSRKDGYGTPRPPHVRRLAPAADKPGDGSCRAGAGPGWPGWRQPGWRWRWTSA